MAAEIILATPGTENRVFNVKYVLPTEQIEHIEEDVTPDRLRILADAQGYPMCIFRPSSGDEEPLKVNMNAAVVSSAGRIALF